MGSGLVGLYLESTLAGELFTLSRLLAYPRKGSLYRVSQAPDIKVWNTKKKKKLSL